MSEDTPIQDSPIEEPVAGGEPTSETPIAEPTAEPATESTTDAADGAATAETDTVSEDATADAAEEADDETTTEGPDTPIAALLRKARDSYGDAIRSALNAAGLDDVPKNGSDVLDGLRKQGDAASSGLAALLGTSKQAVSQLIDTLELRGYLDRHIDPEDRRKLIVTLTERGQHAAEVIEEAAQKIDAELTARVGEEAMAPLHRALAALGEIHLTPRGAGAAGAEASAETPVTEATAEDITDETTTAPAETVEENAEPEAPAEPEGEQL